MTLATDALETWTAVHTVRRSKDWTKAIVAYSEVDRASRHSNPKIRAMAEAVKLPGNSKDGGLVA